MDVALTIFLCVLMLVFSLMALICVVGKLNDTLTKIGTGISYIGDLLGSIEVNIGLIRCNIEYSEDKEEEE